MLVCGIDFETTGLDTKNDRITEVGAVLMDTSKNWAQVDRMSFFVWEPGYPALSEEVIRITGIKDEMLQNEGVTFLAAHLALQRFAPVEEVSYFVAHNAAYDRSMLTAECERHGLSQFPQEWVCTALDLRSNRQFKSMRLAHLALEYGCVVDPKKLHRAVNDVELMGQMLAEAKANVQDMIAFMKTPNIVVQALIPAPWEDGGKGKAAAQERGYMWQQAKYAAETFPKMWVKAIKENELEDEQRGASFKVRRIK